jgi:prepilin peptidase CpaA
MIALAALGFLLTLLALAAWRDLTTMTIPNGVSVALALGFPLVALALGLDAQTMWAHVAAGAIAFAVCLGLFYSGIIGGGDAKLYPAVAFWMGGTAALPFLLTTFVAGGALAMMLVAARRIAPSGAGTPFVLRRFCDPGEGVPYGLAIATGAIWSLPHVGWISLQFAS